MAHQAADTIQIPDEERAADSRADAMCAVLLVAIAVFTAVFWISGH
jgi:hypothetical protein